MPITLNGSAGVTTNSGAVYDGIQRGTAVTASGTSIDFTGIPSWVKRITVMFNGVSTNSTSNLLVRVGSGSITTTGYVSTSYQVTTSSLSWGTSTVGFHFQGNSAASIYNGVMVLNNFGNNTWTSFQSVANVPANVTYNGAGISSSLSGALDRISITTVNGTDTFDAGSINILYE
jgi:hypothetical protein